MKHEYLVMKLGNIRGIDFYNEHLKVIEKYGYVDLARVGKRVLVFSRLSEPYFFIKESASARNRIFKVYIAKEILGEKRVPSYYDQLDLNRASWVRISKLEIVDKSEFLMTYTLKNGNQIKALDRGAVSFFYVINDK